MPALLSALKENDPKGYQKFHLTMMCICWTKEITFYKNYFTLGWQSNIVNADTRRIIQSVYSLKSEYLFRKTEVKSSTCTQTDWMTICSTAQALQTFRSDIDITGTIKKRVKDVSFCLQYINKQWNIEVMFISTKAYINDNGKGTYMKLDHNAKARTTGTCLK